MKALVTGFEPFGADALNSSLDTARSLPHCIGRFHVVAQELPVVYGRSMRALEAMIRAERPDCVICLGLAGGRKEIAIETVARNAKDARLPDNDGNQPHGEPIDPHSPLLLPSNLPVGALLRALRSRGLPAALSTSAGTYLCNYVFYGLARRIAREDPAVRGGFLHLPYSRALAPAHPGSPFLDLEELVRSVGAALEVLSR